MTTTFRTQSNAHAAVGSVAPGHYAKKQLNCRSSVIAFSHRARFQTAVDLAGENRLGRLLDYGSGDGTFLSLINSRFGECVGADIANDQIEDCRMRFKAVPNVKFCEISDLAGQEHTAAYDVVTCMEVLEHCPEPAIENALADICRLVSPEGKVIVSVPIETGATFILKYVIRAVAGWRPLSDYRYYERYRIGDTWRMIFANASTRVVRPVYNEGGPDFHSHYGFNWHSVEDRVRAALRVEQIMFSPFNLFGGSFSSQAWLICRHR